MEAEQAHRGDDCRNAGRLHPVHSVIFGPQLERLGGAERSARAALTLVLDSTAADLHSPLSLQAWYAASGFAAILYQVIPSCRGHNFPKRHAPGSCQQSNSGHALNINMSDT